MELYGTEEHATSGFDYTYILVDRIHPLLVLAFSWDLSKHKKKISTGLNKSTEL